MNTINRQLEEYNLSVFNEEEFEKIKLRDDVLTQLAKYCSNLSQDLWAEYNYQIVPKLLQLPWSSELHFEFLQFKRLIDTQGLYTAGNAILLSLLELLKTKSESRNNKHLH